MDREPTPAFHGVRLSSLAQKAFARVAAGLPLASSVQLNRFGDAMIRGRRFASPRLRIRQGARDFRKLRHLIAGGRQHG
jgi:hypothetical protein